MRNKVSNTLILTLGCMNNFAYHTKHWCVWSTFGNNNKNNKHDTRSRFTLLKYAFHMRWNTNTTNELTSSRFYFLIKPVQFHIWYVCVFRICSERMKGIRNKTKKNYLLLLSVNLCLSNTPDWHTRKRNAHCSADSCVICNDRDARVKQRYAFRCIDMNACIY